MSDSLTKPCEVTAVEEVVSVDCCQAVALPSGPLPGVPEVPALSPVPLASPRGWLLCSPTPDGSASLHNFLSLSLQALTRSQFICAPDCKLFLCSVNDH